MAGRVAKRFGSVRGRVRLRAGGFLLILFVPFPAGAISEWFALSAYLALYMVFWVWFCWRTFHGRRGLGGHLSSAAPDYIETDAFREFFSVPLPKRILWALAARRSGSRLKCCFARLFTGFPWKFARRLSAPHFTVIQIASLPGFTASRSWWLGFQFLSRWGASVGIEPCAIEGLGWHLIVPLVVLLGVAQWAHSIEPPSSASTTLKTVLVQPSSRKTLIWDTNQNAIRFTELWSFPNALCSKRPMPNCWFGPIRPCQTCCGSNWAPIGRSRIWS